MTFTGNDYSNKTVYGTDSDAVRYTWAGYYLLVFASSLIGDATILIASIKYRAIKLHKIMILIIQHIAVCDLMVSITDVIPLIVCTIAGEWVLGNLYCYVKPYVKFYLHTANMLLICCMSTSKLFTLKYPLVCGTITSKQANMLCLPCWLAASIVPGIFLLVDWRDIYFSYRNYQCVYGSSSVVWQWLKPLMGLIFSLFPILLVSGSTIITLVAAKRVAARNRKSLKWQGIMTSVLTASVYCISVLPIFVWTISEAAANIDDTGKTFFHFYFYRIGSSLVLINTISNFYIYSLTVLSFRDFIRSRRDLIYRSFRVNITWG